MLVPLFVVSFGLIAKILVSVTLGGEYFGLHKWPFAVSLIPSAVSCWFLGKHLQNRPAKLVRDEQTGREVFDYDEARHDFFFLPVIAWSVILVVIALLLLGVELNG